MLIIEYGTPSMSSRLAEVATVYRNAFANPPWSLAWSQEHAEQLIQDAMSHEGFEAFFALGAEEKVLGAFWYYPMQLSRITQELTKPVAQFAKNLVETNDLSLIVYNKAIFVDPDCQDKGIGKQLRALGMSAAPRLYGDQHRILWLTRHREDNPKIIQLSEKMGFTDSGLRMPSESSAMFVNRFYYKITI